MYIESLCNLKKKHANKDMVLYTYVKTCQYTKLAQNDDVDKNGNNFYTSSKSSNNFNTYSMQNVQNTHFIKNEDFFLLSLCSFVYRYCDYEREKERSKEWVCVRKREREENEKKRT